MSEGVPGGKIRILVADDDPELLAMLGLQLRKRGYEVFEADDGNEAANLARREHPDLIILDVMMPQKNGWEVAREIRSAEATQDIGIVILTAIGVRMNEMTSPLYGADSYVDKPFEFAILEREIEGVLKKRGKK